MHRERTQEFLVSEQRFGLRPSRALPCELHVSARSELVRGSIELIFANGGDTAAGFQVFDPLNLGRSPRRYIVEPRKRVDDSWAAMADNGGPYDLRVLGPHGFHRHFKGDLNSLRACGAPDPEVRVGYHARRGDVRLKLRNEGQRACVFTVTPRAYRNDGPWTVRADGGGNEAELRWELGASAFRYDFAVTCDADPTYLRRFAGRVETGSPR